MSERRVYLGWALTHELELPLDVARQIVREVYRAGASARRALLRFITRARILNYWIYDTGFEEGDDIQDRFLNQMTQHWLDLGQAFWTGRERRYVERRRILRPHRRFLGTDNRNNDVWEQWGIGSR